MKYLALSLMLLSGPVQADDRVVLYGVWGTAAQCAERAIIPGGTKRAAPFELRPGWLRHGDLWCRLTWFPALPRNDGVFVATQALCGEDSVRAYRLDFDLSGQDLRLIWEERLINGPLQRCPNM